MLGNMQTLTGGGSTPFIVTVVKTTKAVDDTPDDNTLQQVCGNSEALGHDTARTYGPEVR